MRLTLPEYSEDGNLLLEGSQEELEMLSWGCATAAGGEPVHGPMMDENGVFSIIIRLIPDPECRPNLFRNESCVHGTQGCDVVHVIY
jgi:hypothetical protein